MIEKVVNQIGITDIKSLDIGKSLNFNDSSPYYLQRKYIARKWELEGEIYLPGWKGILEILEFSATDGTHIEVHAYLSNLIVAYETVYTSFEELKLTNTRKSSFKGKKNRCLNCSTEIVVKTWPYAQSCACSGCKARYELKQTGEFVEKGKDEAEIKFELSIGLTGIFNGITYEVIGCAQKQELNAYKSKWKEYTLFNEQDGYAFLSEYEGHWILVKEKGDTPVMELSNDSSFKYGSDEFRLYNEYSCKVIDSVGEFPYNIYDDQSLKVREYINPPEMWIREKSNAEGINWFLGQHVSKHTVSNEFAVGLPWKSGVGAIEPKGYLAPRKLIIVTLAMLLLIFAVHAIMASSMKEKVLLQNVYQMPDSIATLNVVSDKFELHKWKSNLAFDIKAPVSNNWFELAITLVNTTTGQEFTLEQGVEYYSGYSGGESWSEGRNAETAYLSSIPAGTYFLQLQASSDPSNKVSDFQLKVTNDMPMEKNMWVMVFLVLLWPLIKYLFNRYYERERWRNSDYSPYTYES